MVDLPEGRWKREFLRILVLMGHLFIHRHLALDGDGGVIFLEVEHGAGGYPACDYQWIAIAILDRCEKYPIKIGAGPDYTIEVSPSLCSSAGSKIYGLD